MIRRRAGYYEDESCDAHTRTRHPDGATMPCRKTGRHARLDVAEQYVWTAAGVGAEVFGPFRDFFCDQHVIEFDAGLNVFDPDRPRLPRAPQVRPGICR